MATVPVSKSSTSENYSLNTDWHNTLFCMLILVVFVSLAGEFLNARW